MMEIVRSVRKEHDDNKDKKENYRTKSDIGGFNMKTRKIVRINKKAAASLLAVLLTFGTMTAPLQENGRSVIAPINITVANAAQIVSYNINSTPTYRALTKEKVKQLYLNAYYGANSYNGRDELTYYKPGKQPSTSGGWYEGELSDDTLKAIENTVNLYRTLAGLYPITAESGSLYQKGALVRSTDETFEHHLNVNSGKPAGMSYDLWKTGVGCPNSILYAGATPSYVARGWISERGNVNGETNTGHRMCLLKTDCDKMYFGYANGVALGSPSWCEPKMKEAASTFPSAGYMPAELVDERAQAPWMIQFNPKKLKIKDIKKVKLTIEGNNKTYTRTYSNGGLRKGSSSNSYSGECIEFTKPPVSGNGCYSGNYTVTVTGLTDIATGKDASVTYTIKFFNANDYASKTSISEFKGTTVSLSCEKYTYDGSRKTPSVTVNHDGKTLVRNVDYTVSYENNTNVGTATLNVVGKGKYQGRISRTFEIEPAKTKEISKCSIKIASSNISYNGRSQQPGVTVKDGTATLKKGTDYTVSYSNNINAGTAKVTITGKGRYSGKVSKNFTILPQNIAKLDCSLEYTSVRYDGKAKKPSVTLKNGSVTLIEGRDYTISYSNNVNKGTAKVIITCKGNYCGTTIRNFTITDSVKNISNCNVKLSASEYVYSGAQCKPAVTVKDGAFTLKKGTDYTVSYSNNINAGTARVVIIGKGRYSGRLTKSFTISRLSVRKCVISVSKTATPPKKLIVKVSYNGKEISSDNYTITLDFTNSDKDRIRIIVSGKNNLKDSFEINTYISYI